MSDHASDRAPPPTPEIEALAEYIEERPLLKYVLETHYIGAQHPTVLVFDDAASVYEAVERRHRCHAGLSHTIIRPA